MNDTQRICNAWYELMTLLPNSNVEITIVNSGPGMPHKATLTGTTSGDRITDWILPVKLNSFDVNNK